MARRVLHHVLGPAELLFSEENPNGVHLEDLLEQLVDELQCRRARDGGGAREGALVITRLEEAILWRRRELEAEGRAEWLRHSAVARPPVDRILGAGRIAEDLRP